MFLALADPAGRSFDGWKADGRDAVAEGVAFEFAQVRTVAGERLHFGSPSGDGDVEAFDERTQFFRSRFSMHFFAFEMQYVVAIRAYGFLFLVADGDGDVLRRRGGEGGGSRRGGARKERRCHELLVLVTV